ncbi:hypothetical protein BKA65DRAFT_535649 [Rhexocercosporidium sp. MPI-PUGE-AT-0058]|nr:hypothetical protein BKA65DRAFT_535649 [Rhexocercosporidium sp. MPI-PUGE-AT-0058]
MNCSARGIESPPGESLNNPFIFSGGDVRLKVITSGQPIVGSVSSQAMASACKVWKNFVFPPWAESLLDRTSGTPIKVVQIYGTMNNLPDTALSLSSLRMTKGSSDEVPSKLPVEELDFTGDNSEALLILLRIAHRDFEKVPPNLSYTELLNLAVLCDQYDCVKMTKPWIEDWLKGEATLSLWPGHENWLFIAWVFGRATVFEDLAIHLIRTIRIDGEGYCRNTQDKPLAEPIPAGIIEPICSIRKEIIRQLLDPAYQDLDHYEYRQRPVCPYRRSRSDQLACDAKIHDSLRQSLNRVGLFPRKSSSKILYNVNELCGRLRSITIERHDQTHMCGPPYKYSAHVRNTLIRIPGPVKRFHVEHMGGQRASLLSETCIKG